MLLLALLPIIAAIAVIITLGRIGELDAQPNTMAFEDYQYHIYQLNLH